jgi:hypothetical protein
MTAPLTKSQPKVISTGAISEILSTFTRDQLRLYAKSIGVKVGRNKSDTIKNLTVSHKCRVQALLIRE